MENNVSNGRKPFCGRTRFSRIFRSKSISLVSGEHVLGDDRRRRLEFVWRSRDRRNAKTRNVIAPRQTDADNEYDVLSSLIIFY